MPRTEQVRPTDAELEILRVLWRIGPATVRQVRDVLARRRNPARGRDVGYTTVLKLLQIMTDKGLVRRQDDGRRHIYHARYSEEHVQRSLLRDLAARAFGGSRSQLVLRALADERATPAELAEVRRLLDGLKAGDRANDSGNPAKGGSP
jgi:BlaI family penicillinase repressor